MAPRWSRSVRLPKLPFERGVRELQMNELSQCANDVAVDCGVTRIQLFDVPQCGERARYRERRLFDANKFSAGSAASASDRARRCTSDGDPSAASDRPGD